MLCKLVSRLAGLSPIEDYYDNGVAYDDRPIEDEQVKLAWFEYGNDGGFEIKRKVNITAKNWSD